MIELSSHQICGFIRFVEAESLKLVGGFVKLNLDNMGLDSFWHTSFFKNLNRTINAVLNSKGGSIILECSESSARFSR